MPAYAPNFTGRLRVHYHVGGRNHVQTWRLPGAPSPTQIADALSAIQSYYTAIAGDTYDDFAFNAVTVAPADTDVFLPVANTLAITGGESLSGKPLSVTALELCFVGRSIAGGPFKLFQYGVNMQAVAGSTGADFRVIEGEQVSIDAAIAALQAATAAGKIISNDGTVAVVYNYANVSYNARWKKKVRGTGSVFP